ncbi:hypothetical protein JJB07_12360 [Tumebacillus sp. ITR2]|uniref:Uncharacterized protein n=1 Tax=Tumebacillus amylolyticus TaxID=2801339 RepID=A0ABS1JB33_9BACL|nr:CBO0543 family protein [Tumebacillus amylolyticus]MBL0387446.1 hypothetical protein [Tumebacillus amylolyticus]
MVFSIVLFVGSWLFFLFLGKKKKFYVLSPTCYVAMILGLSTDVMIDAYGLWEYPATTGLQSFWRHILDDFGIYFVVTYLFLQTLPKQPNFWNMVLHIFYWSVLAFGLEFLALKTGNLKHRLWWNLGFSYVSDVGLYLIFYYHHRWRVRME